MKTSMRDIANITNTMKEYGLKFRYDIPYQEPRQRSFYRVISDHLWESPIHPNAARKKVCELQRSMEYSGYFEAFQPDEQFVKKTFGSETNNPSEVFRTAIGKSLDKDQIPDIRDIQAASILLHKEIHVAFMFENSVFTVRKFGGLQFIDSNDRKPILLLHLTEPNAYAELVSLNIADPSPSAPHALHENADPISTNPCKLNLQPDISLRKAVKTCNLPAQNKHSLCHTWLFGIKEIPNKPIKTRHTHSFEQDVNDHICFGNWEIGSTINDTNNSLYICIGKIVYENEYLYMYVKELVKKYKASNIEYLFCVKSMLSGISEKQIKYEEKEQEVKTFFSGIQELRIISTLFTADIYVYDGTKWQYFFPLHGYHGIKQCRSYITLHRGEGNHFEVLIPRRQACSCLVSKPDIPSELKHMFRGVKRKFMSKG